MKTSNATGALRRESATQLGLYTDRVTPGTGWGKILAFLGVMALHTTAHASSVSAAPSAADATTPANEGSLAATITTLQQQIAGQQAMLQELQRKMAEQQTGEAGGTAKPASAGGSRPGETLPTRPASVMPEGGTLPVPAVPATPVTPVQHDAAETTKTPVPAMAGDAGEHGLPGAGAAPAGAVPVPAVPPVPDADTGTAPATASGSADMALTPAQREAYASGVTVWREIENSMSSQRALGIQLDPHYVMQGIQDMYAKKNLRMSREAIDTLMTTLNQQFLDKSRAAREATEEQGQAYRVAFSKRKGAKSDAGAWYQVVAAGSGRKLRPSDVVVLSVTGTLPDGTVFDPSGQNGRTKTARVGALLPAVAIGLQKIAAGGHVKIVVPPNKGYGDAGLPPAIPGGATLIFDVRVMSVSAK
ncbi:TPA: FKBP-type peptidyl-prolyl cis-trans isomerase [Serratia marcescens]